MSQQSRLIQRLCEAESPYDFSGDWSRREGHYVMACRVTAEDIPGLIDIARQWHTPDWSPNVEGLDVEPDYQMLPITAWRTLAELKAEAAAEPLVDMVGEVTEYDEWMEEELPHVLGKIGESAIEALTRLARDPSADDHARALAACGLRCVADYHPGTRDGIVAALKDMLERATEDNIYFNTTLFSELVELQAVEAAEAIERAFAADLVDVGMMGDWNDVRKMLGVAGLGLEMPANPHNSIEQFRIQVGIGIFTQDAIFPAYDGIDDDAEQAYYKQAHDAFSASPEAQQVIDRFGDLIWSASLLQFGIRHLGQIVDEMTSESVDEYVFDFVLRNVSTQSENAAAIIGELVMFWKYLDRVYALPAAKSVIDWLETDGIVDDLEAALGDPLNFDMAKSMAMAGFNAGFDMSSEEGLAAFVMACNQSLTSDTPTIEPVIEPPVTDAPRERVGRNDPCPCGSGKKYKKCCL